MSTVKFTSSDIADLPRRFRARLINSLSGFKSANLIGSTDKNGVFNLAMVSSVVHLGADPALIGMVMRPRVAGMAPRDTIVNIENTGVYTINHVSGAMLPAAHEASANYPSDTCEFAATGLTPFFPNSGFAAPAVAESPLQIGLKLREIVPFAVNGTEFVIGEIVWVRFAEHALQGDGYVDIENLGSIAVSGLDGYHNTTLLGRYSYAEPNEAAEKLPPSGTPNEPVVDLSAYRERKQSS